MGARSAGWPRGAAERCVTPQRGGVRARGAPGRRDRGAARGGDAGGTAGRSASGQAGSQKSLVHIGQSFRRLKRFPALLRFTRLFGFVVVGPWITDLLSYFMKFLTVSNNRR